jgi:hypothetical protein
MLTFLRFWFLPRVNLNVIFDVQVKHVAKTIEYVTTVASQISCTRNISKKKCMINRKKNKKGEVETEINGQRYEYV